MSTLTMMMAAITLRVSSKDAVACRGPTVASFAVNTFPRQLHDDDANVFEGNKVGIEEILSLTHFQPNTLRPNKSTKNFFINIFMCFIRP